MASWVNYGVFLLLLLVLMSPVLAADKIDDRWVWYGDTYERDGVVHYVEAAGDLYKVLLYIDDVPFILRFEGCKDNDARNERYCVEEAAFDDPDNYADKIKYEHGDELFGYRIVTYDYVPELQVTRAISPTTAVFGKPSTITVVIENTGEKPIESIKYRENISSEFTIVPNDVVAINREIIYDVAILGASGKRTFQYALIPKEYITKTITPTVTYAYEHLKKSVTVPGISINVPSPIKITKTLSSASAGLNEEITYAVTIKNEEDGTMHVKATIVPPEGMVLKTLDDIKNIGGELVFDDDLRANTESGFSFTFSFPRTGEYSFSLDVDASVSGKTIDRSYVEEISVGTAKLEPRFTFSKTGNKIRSGQSATLRTYLKNTDEQTNYANIVATLVSDLLKRTEKITAKSVAAGADQLVGEFTITAPAVNTTTNKVFTFAGNYSTKDGEQFVFSKTLTISVQPDTRRFAVTHALNTTTPHPGDAVKMIVKVKNTAGKYLFVDVYDTFSEVIPLISGTSQAKLSLDSEQERQVYIYEFKIPEDYVGDLVITTHVFEEEEGTEEETIALTVTEKPPEETQQEIETNDDASTEGSGGDIVEKKSFFRKAWDWMVNLFTFS